MRLHGTRIKYVVERCRCAPCRAANSRYQCARKTRKVPVFRLRHVGGGWWLVVRHRGKPELERARFRDRAAAAAFCAAINRVAVENGGGSDPTWADGALVAAARAHVAALRATGIGLRAIAASAGLKRQTVGDIVRGRRARWDRPARRSVLFVTAHRILGVTTATPIAAGARVPAGPTWARLGTLLAAGLTGTAIARLLGSTAHRPSLQIRRNWILQRTATAVARLHPPPPRRQAANESLGER